MRMRNFNIFYKHMLLVFAATCLPMAIIALSNYWIGIHQIKAETNRNHQLQMTKIVSSLEEQIARIEALGNQWSFHPLFSQQLVEGELQLKHNETRELLTSLRILQGAHPLIENVVLYIRNQDLLISEEEGINPIGNEQSKAIFSHLLENPTALFWWEDAAVPLKYKSTTQAAMVHKVQNENLEAYGALLFYLSKQQLDDLLYPLNPDGQGVAMIIKQNGELLTNGRARASEEAQLLNEALSREIVDRGLDSGDFMYKRDRISYSVSVGVFETNGWRYIVATPITKLMAPVILTLKLTLAVCLFSLLVAILVSWFTSRNIYRPIRHVVGLIREGSGSLTDNEGKNEFAYIEHRWRNLTKESKALQSSLEQSRLSLKEGFMRQWIQGHLAYLNEDELQDRLEGNGWMLRGKGFAILLVRLDDIAGTMGRFNKGDEQLAAFAAANIAEEIMSGAGTEAQVINFYDLSVAVLMAYEADCPKEQIKKQLFQLAEALIGELTRFLRMRVTVGVGKLVYRADSIHKSLEEARQVMRFRDMDKREQILDMENLLPHNASPVSYPFDMEEELLQCIRMGLEEEAVKKLRLFVDSLKPTRGRELLFRQGMMQLLGSILHALMKSGIDSGALYRGHNLYEQLGELTDPEEIQQWFETAIVGAFVRVMADNRNKRIEQIVDKVIDIISRRYSSAISLESCADEAGITSYNLSKAFKYHTGANFIDYLTNVRLDKAKELLRSSELKMSEIAERVGYQPTYFLRIFKKNEGITPGQYRIDYSSQGRDG